MAVAGGGGNIGNINSSPAAYNTFADVATQDMIVSNYPSWRGTADPASPFQNESGTALFFSVVITGTNINLSEVSFTQQSNDPTDYFGDGVGGPYMGSFSSSDYAPDAVGIDSHGNVITSGSGTQSVDEIILTGVSAAFDGSNTYFPGINDQQSMAEAIAAYDTLGSFTITTCFSIDSTSNCGNVNVGPAPGPVPEPGTLGFLGLGLAALPIAYRRVRRHQV